MLAHWNQELGPGDSGAGPAPWWLKPGPGILLQGPGVPELVSDPWCIWSVPDTAGYRVWGVFFFFFKPVLGLSCGMKDLSCGMRTLNCTMQTLLL